MVRFALKGLLGRKLRTALTAIAIVLGVAMVAGHVHAHGLDRQGVRLDLHRRPEGVERGGHRKVGIRPERGRAAPTRRRSTSRCYRRCRRLPAVAEAEGSVDGEAQLIGEDGKAIVYGGAPNLGFSVSAGDSPFNPLTLVEGAWPKAGERRYRRVDGGQGGLPARPSRSACRPRAPRRGFGSRGSSASARSRRSAAPRSRASTSPTAQELFGKRGRLDEIAVAAKPGVSDERARPRRSRRASRRLHR